MNFDTSKDCKDSVHKFIKDEESSKTDELIPEIDKSCSKVQGVSDEFCPIVKEEPTMAFPKTQGQSDEYAYTKTSRFTSEIFKIEVGNLPRRFGYGECKKLMSRKLQLKPHKINVVSRINKAYVTFKNEEDKAEAFEKLQGFEYKGKQFHVKNAKPKADAMAAKRSLEKSDDVSEKKKFKLNDENISPQEMLKNTVTPWWKMSYGEQLEEKHRAMCKSLAELRKNICAIDNLDGPVFRWLMQQKKESGLCCPTRQILSSPTIIGYRNKCGFTVGENVNGEITVGFRLGKYRDQLCAVESPTEILHVSEKMKEIACCFAKYVQQSDLKPYNKHTFKGHWKQVTVRMTRNNSVMVTISMTKQDLTEEQLSSEQNSVKDFFKSSNCQFETLLWQMVPIHIDPSGDTTPAKILEGEGVIYESLFDLKFRISPTAFFQCNTAGAEVLYSCVRDLVLHGEKDQDNSVLECDNQKTILLDVCCGTGTIGLSLAKYVKEVIGVDICQEAIDDAKINAKLNDIANVQYHCGKAEDVLPNLIHKLSHAVSDIVAVVDPPRCGLHNKVIKALRQCAFIKKLVYVSCSVDQARTNFIDLCRPSSKRLSGFAFKPILAQPVDLFPHTAHCELVLLLERISPDIPKPDAEGTKAELITANTKDETAL